MKSTLSVCFLLAGVQTLVHGHRPHCHSNEYDHIYPTEPDSQVEEAYPCKSKAYFKLAPSNADFAFRFYQLVVSEESDKNVFFSPISISISFAMLALGAKSATLNQILEGLAFNMEKTQEKEVHEGFCHLICVLNHTDCENQLNMGNALFIEETLRPLQTFLEDVKNFYDSEVLYTDFQNSTAAEKLINDYIGTKTYGKITDLVQDLDPQTVMVLVNYVFFKGKECCNMDLYCMH